MTPLFLTPGCTFTVDFRAASFASARDCPERTPSQASRRFSLWDGFCVAQVVSVNSIHRLTIQPHLQVGQSIRVGIDLRPSEQVVSSIGKALTSDLP